jgi:hypothetical protein
MGTHTDGPWKAVRTKHSWWVNDASGNRVCKIIPWTQAVDSADANLIAAAPELLAGCKAALNLVMGDGQPPSWDWLREIVAKAEGVPIEPAMTTKPDMQTTAKPE